MNILYIGSDSTLSLEPFRALLESENNICAFAFDELNNDFNVIKEASIQSLAFTHSIPLIKLDKNYSNTISQIKYYQPDIILVSCYARLLPQSILSLPKYGCFNVHPSLLPKFRGPIPLFWQFHDGADNFGVTVHRLSDKFDIGNIVAQETVNIEDGLSQIEANQKLSNVAGNMALKLMDDLKNSSITEIEQNNNISSYQSYPEKKDFMVSNSWSAKKLYNFISAYKSDVTEFLCKVDGEEFIIVDIYSYQQQPYENMDGQKVMLLGSKLWLSCQDGYIECKVKTN